jgi:hypothetical protein
MGPSAIPNQTPKPQEAPGWVRALPAIGGTAGSIIGGLLGGGAGVAAGAAVPGADLTGVPEVAGGIGGYKLGSTAGAGIGGGAGQAAEDFLTHNLNAGSWGRVGGSALENAIGDLVGGTIVKGGSMLVNGAKGLLEGAAVKRGAQAATDAAGQAAADAAKAATERANMIKNNYGGLGASLQKDLGLGKNIDFADSVGLNGADPYDLRKAAGAGLDMNKVVDQALQTSNPINMDKFGNNVFGQMQKNGVTDLAASPLGKAMTAAGIDISKMPKEMPATQVRQLMQSVGDQIGNYQHIVNAAENNGVINTEAISHLDSLRSVYKDLGDRIYTNNPEFNQTLAGIKVSPGQATELEGKYGKQLADHIVNAINNAKTSKDIMPEMQRFVNMNSASKMAINDIENAPATARGVARAQDANPGPAKPGINMTPSVLDALAIGGAPFTGGASLLGLLPHVAQVASSPVVQDTALAGLNKATEGAAAKIVPTLTRAGAIAGANIPGLAPQPTAGNASAIPAVASGGAPPAPGGALNQTYQQDMSAQGSLLDLAGRTPANFGGTGLATAAAGFGGIAAGLAPQVQKQGLAAEALGGLVPSFENAGGAQGTLGGLLTQATSIIPGSAANTYQREQATAAAALASLLGISPQEAAGLLPRLTQDANTAAPNQQVLENILGTVHPNNGGSMLNQLAIPALTTQ